MVRKRMLQRRQKDFDRTAGKRLSDYGRGGGRRGVADPQDLLCLQRRKWRPGRLCTVWGAANDTVSCALGRLPPGNLG